MELKIAKPQYEAALKKKKLFLYVKKIILSCRKFAGSTLVSE